MSRLRRLRVGTSRLQRFSFRVFGPLAQRRIVLYPQLGTKLSRAGDPLVPQAYLAQVYGAVAAAAGLGLMALAVYLAFGGLADPDPGLLAPLVAAPFLFGILAYSYALLKPDLEVVARRRNLEANLPYGLNFMASLAAAGVVPDRIFKTLGEQPVYGDMSVEANRVYRDTRMLSADVVGAMRAGARRSPSRQWEELLQGAVNTITSGGEFSQYLQGKAEQFTQENRRKQRAFLDSLGVMAESYVVMAAAAPLFLIVILSVMMVLSTSGNPVFYLNLIALVGLPVLHVSFTTVFRNLRPD